MIHHISNIKMVGHQEATLFVFGDMQYEAEGFSKEAWQEFKHEFKTTRNAYALGLGDYSDNFRPTIIGRLAQALAGDDSARQQMDNEFIHSHDKMLDDMEFLKGKMIGVHTGHHKWEFADGSNSDQRLASALKSTYLDWEATTRINFRLGNSDKGHNLTYAIVSLHGSSESRTTGATANWIENNILNKYDSDHIFVGHCCKSIHWQPGEKYRIRRSGPAGVISYFPKCTQVPGFHDGYIHQASDAKKIHRASYVEKRSFKPLSKGWAVVKFVPQHGKLIHDMTGVGPETKKLRVSTNIRTFEGQ